MAGEEKTSTGPDYHWIERTYYILLDSSSLVVLAGCWNEREATAATRPGHSRPSSSLTMNSFGGPLLLLLPNRLCSPVHTSHASESAEARMHSTVRRTP